MLIIFRIYYIRTFIYYYIFSLIIFYFYIKLDIYFILFINKLLLVNILFIRYNLYTPLVTLDRYHIRQNTTNGSPSGKERLIRLTRSSIIRYNI